MTDRIDLYVAAAMDIFEQAMQKARVLDQGVPQKRWALKLRDELQKNESIAPLLSGFEWENYDSYLRDRYNNLQKRNVGPNQLIGFILRMAKPLLIYTGNEDYKAFNDTFGQPVQPPNVAPGANEPATEEPVSVEPLEIFVLYTPVSFGLFDFLRNTDNGVIYIYPNGDFAFDGNDNLLFIKRSWMIEACSHLMYNDDTLWIKIVYQGKIEQETAYFALMKTDAPRAGTLAADTLLKLLKVDEHLKSVRISLG